MKTKNIFRTLLMAAMLLVGVGSAQATERTIWEQGPKGEISISSDEFVSVPDSSVLRVYANAEECYIYYVVNYQWFGLWATPDYPGNDYIRTWNQEYFSQYYDSSKGCFFFTLTKDKLDILKENDLGVRVGNITKVTIESAGEVVIIPKFTLTYVSQGDTLKTETLAEGATPTPPTTNPTKDGYKFAGWDNLPETMPAHDVTVTALFVPLYTLTYISQGQTLKTEQLAEGATPTPPAAPVRYDGYTFAGWDNLPETMPAQDVTVTALFNAPLRTLTYKYTVNWNNETTYRTYSVREGDSITSEPYPTLEGYTFSGWGEILATMPNYDYTISGNFLPAKHYVIFMIGGSVYKRVEYDYGATINEEQSPYREGHTFNGWTGYPDVMVMGNEDIVITGSFTANKHSLIYVVDNEEVARYQVAFGTTITPDAEPAQRPGYKFSGWSTIPSTMPDNDYYIYGNFQEVEMDKYTIYYQVDEQVVSQERLVEGAKPNPPAVAYKTGYTFKRWTGVPSAMPAEDVIVTAEFEINSYKLTYMVDGDEYYYYYVNYGSVIEPESEPSRNGYEFSGWLNVPETMPAKDVVIEGYFKPEAQYVEAVISSSTGYATFCSNFPLNFTRVQGLKAYIARSISTDVVELQQVTGVVPAGTGLILKGESDRIPVADSDGSAISGNLLVGVTDTDQTLSSTGYYVLTEELIEGEEVVAKFAETGANTAIVPAGHAYLIAPSSNSRSHLSIVFSKQTTGIGGAWVSEGADEVISDLQGHRVLNPKKGRLYIIGGRKVVLK